MTEEKNLGGCATLLEQYRILRLQVPLMYAMMVLNASFVSFAMYRTVSHTYSIVAPGVLVLAAAVRALLWLRRGDTIPTSDQIRRYLKAAVIAAAVLSLGFGGWALLLFQQADLIQRTCIGLYIFIGAIICSYCLQPLPAAGRLVLLCGAMPVTLRLLITGELFLVGLGINLLFISMLILRMIATGHAGFIEVLSSRSEIIAERERALDAERRAHTLAYHDPLTGLPNRRALADHVETLTTEPAGLDGVALLIVDLDHFKSINDVHGHPSGDAVLRSVASRLDDLVGQEARAFRLGGDEFAIVAPIRGDRDSPRKMARRIVHGMAEPFRTGDLLHHIGASVGISVFPSDAHDRETLMRRADIALYRAKEAGRGQHRSFEPVMDADIKRRSALESELRASIAADGFRPAYQPIVELASGRTIGFELLARWPRAGAEIGPDQFIQIAEESGLITDLMLQLLHRGCTEALAWDPRLTIAINVSPVQLKDRWLSEKILAVLARTGFAPHRLGVEITENALIADAENAARTIQSLKNQGVRISLDDFGTGYSSLQHLRMLPFDNIKIDRSFVKSLDRDEEAFKIVRAITGLASTLGLAIVAEGIETAAVADLLRELGCAYGQGFHLGRPLCAADVPGFLAGQEDLPVALSASG